MRWKAALSLQELLKGAFSSFCKEKGLLGFAGTMYKLTTGCSERLESSKLGNISNIPGCSPEKAAVADLALCEGVDEAISRGASQTQPCCVPVILWRGKYVCLGLTCWSMSTKLQKEKKSTKIGPLFLIKWQGFFTTLPVSCLSWRWPCPALLFAWGQQELPVWWSWGLWGHIKQVGLRKPETPPAMAQPFLCFFVCFPVKWSLYGQKMQQNVVTAILRYLEAFSLIFYFIITESVLSKRTNNGNFSSMESK